MTNVIQLFDNNPINLLKNGDIEAFQNHCRLDPDYLPRLYEYTQEFFSYAVGFWWLSLKDDHQKKEQLEKHPIFAEKFTVQTCIDYATACKKIPATHACVVMNKMSIRTLKLITRGGKTDEELDLLFSVATATNASSTTMETLIREWKEDSEIGEILFDESLNILTGDRKDKRNVPL